MSRYMNLIGQNARKASLQKVNTKNFPSVKLIDKYTGAISKLEEPVKQFTSNTKNRDKALENFESGRIHALVSMKCLDEGVDVPRSELAIFCASTGNPRQFIQRRGRVLRTHPKKSIATIHDLVVIPKIKISFIFFSM